MLSLVICLCAFFTVTLEILRLIRFKKTSTPKFILQKMVNWSLFHFFLASNLTCHTIECLPPVAESDVLEATAQFDFIARSDRELSLKKGDHVLLFSQVSNDWWRGSVNGQEGLIPDKYVLLKMKYVLSLLSETTRARFFCNTRHFGLIFLIWLLQMGQHVLHKVVGMAYNIGYDGDENKRPFEENRKTGKKCQFQASCLQSFQINNILHEIVDYKINGEY